MINTLYHRYDWTRNPIFSTKDTGTPKVIVMQFNVPRIQHVHSIMKQ